MWWKRGAGENECLQAQNILIRHSTVEPMIRSTRILQMRVKTFRYGILLISIWKHFIMSMVTVWDERVFDSLIRPPLSRSRAGYIIAKRLWTFSILLPHLCLVPYFLRIRLFCIIIHIFLYRNVFFFAHEDPYLDSQILYKQSLPNA